MVAVVAVAAVGWLLFVAGVCVDTSGRYDGVALLLVTLQQWRACTCSRVCVVVRGLSFVFHGAGFSAVVNVRGRHLSHQACCMRGLSCSYNGFVSSRARLVAQFRSAPRRGHRGGGGFLCPAGGGITPTRQHPCARWQRCQGRTSGTDIVRLRGSRARAGVCCCRVVLRRLAHDRSLPDACCTHVHFFF